MNVSELEGLKYHHITIVAMASTEDEIKSLIASGSTKDEGIGKMSPKEDRMKILESYVGIIKLNKPLTLCEIFELEEDIKIREEPAPLTSSKAER
jgi:hypothetical protein